LIWSTIIGTYKCKLNKNLQDDLEIKGGIEKGPGETWKNMFRLTASPSSLLLGMCQPIPKVKQCFKPKKQSELIKMTIKVYKYMFSIGIMLVLWQKLATKPALRLETMA
jgi:hypothetical protein